MVWCVIDGIIMVLRVISGKSYSRRVLRSFFVQKEIPRTSFMYQPPPKIALPAS